jgi:Domain of unknown function (DUF5679)
MRKLVCVVLYPRAEFSHEEGCARQASVAPSERFPKGDTQMPEGYCVKERKKVEIKDPQQVTMKNGRPAIQGTCPDCGTKIFKIGKL